MKSRIRTRLAATVAVAFLALPVVATADELTNARVVQMSKLGLGDEIIIAKIKTGQSRFELADQDLMALKQAGVSDKVVAAMLDSAVVRTARVYAEGKPMELHSLAQAKIGGRWARLATAGLKSAKWKAYLQGHSADVVLGSNPNIELELPADDSPDNYLLVRLDQKEDRRELEVGSSGGAVGAKTGIQAEAIVATASSPAGRSRFRLAPTQPLAGGEYMIYVVGSADSMKGIHGKGYDLSVR
jgi:hypothetical protein